MRTSPWSTPELVSSPWPMLDPEPTDLNSSCAQSRLTGLMVSYQITCLEILYKKLCNSWQLAFGIFAELHLYALHLCACLNLRVVFWDASYDLLHRIEGGGNLKLCDSTPVFISYYNWTNTAVTSLYPLLSRQTCCVRKCHRRAGCCQANGRCRLSFRSNFKACRHCWLWGFIIMRKHNLWACWSAICNLMNLPLCRKIILIYSIFYLNYSSNVLLPYYYYLLYMRKFIPCFIFEDYII